MQQYHISHPAQHYTYSRSLHRVYYLSILLCLIELSKVLPISILSN
nr:MAG TPA: hypothetical protein [Crassvirales sp.]